MFHVPWVNVSCSDTDNNNDDPDTDTNNCNAVLSIGPGTVGGYMYI